MPISGKVNCKWIEFHLVSNQLKFILPIFLTCDIFDACEKYIHFMTVWLLSFVQIKSYETILILDFYITD